MKIVQAKPVINQTKSYKLHLLPCFRLWKVGDGLWQTQRRNLNWNGCKEERYMLHSPSIFVQYCMLKEVHLYTMRVFSVYFLDYVCIYFIGNHCIPAWTGICWCMLFEIIITWRYIVESNGHKIFIDTCLLAGNAWYQHKPICNSKNIHAWRINIIWRTV